MAKALAATGVAALLVGAGTSPAQTCAWRLSASVPTKTASVFNAVGARTHDDVWAVGVAASSDSTAEGPTLAERWNGTRWRRTPTPPGSGVLTGVAALGRDDAWAVGARGTGTLILHWDGARWRVAPAPDVHPSALLAVSARSASDVWAVGIRAKYSDQSGPPLVEHWDGTAWRVVEPPPMQLTTDTVSVDATGEVWTNCFVGPRWQMRLPPGITGKRCSDAGAVAVDAHDPVDVWADFGVLAQWDGRVWHRHPLYQPDVAGIAGLAAISSRDVWAAGTEDCCGGAYIDYLAHWNGVRWTRVKSVFPYDIDNALLGIAAVSTRDVWAVGVGAGHARAERYSCVPRITHESR